MSTLFAESDAASEMLDKNFSGKDQGKILASMKIISVKELGAGIFAGAGTIMNAIVEDTKKLGGDDSYQIDIGVWLLSHRRPGKSLGVARDIYAEAIASA